MKSKTLVSMENVSLKYFGNRLRNKDNQVKALNDVNLTLNSGEILGVIGNNGSGKSSLLRLLSGVIVPDEGTCTLKAKNTCLLSLGLGFDPQLTGRRNAMMCGMLMGLTKREILRSIEEIKQFSELGDFFEKPIRVYSSGMHSRLSFSIAMVVETELMLVDEVLSVGDLNFSKKSFNGITEKIKSGTTTVIVSHNLDVLQEICSRIIYMKNGSLIFDGNPSTVINAYKQDIF